MSVLPLTSDYTARDFESLKARLQRGAESVFPAWTDWNVANFGVIISEMVCFVGDVLDVYGSGHKREAFLSTCVRRENAMRHTRRMGYTMRGPSAAQVDLLFTIISPDPTTASVSFEKGSIVRTGSATDPARVQLLTDLLIPAGSQSGIVSAEHSLSWTEVFTSDGSANQEFELSYSPFLEIESITDAGGAWQAIDTFIDSDSDDRHYLLLRTSDNRALVRTGDDTNGRIPTGTFTVNYKTGGGRMLIEQGTLTIPEFSASDALGNSVVFEVTNPASSSGGLEEETIESARVNATANLRVNQRSVTHEDFEINARRVSGVSRALMLTSDRYAGIAENRGILYVLGTGSVLPSGRYPAAVAPQATLDAVKGLIDNSYPPTLTFAYSVLAAPLKAINFTLRVWLTRGANAATVDALIRTNYADFFACLLANQTPNPLVDFGFNYQQSDGTPENLIAWSDLFRVVNNTTGVRKVDEDAFIPVDDVELLPWEFPTPGTFTIINAETGSALV